MVVLTGGFGPFSATQLTGVLEAVVAQHRQRLQHAVLHDVQHRAGHYYAIVEVHSQPPHGSATQTYYGITTATVAPQAAGYHTSIGTSSLFVWQHPADPVLPGLKLAATPAQVQRHFAPHLELNALHTVIYRPMNRAVFRARFAPQRPGELGDTLFLKVLRTGEASPLHALHELLVSAGVPVVEPIATPVHDVLPLAGGHGMPLGEYIRTEGVHNRFDPEALVEILDRLPPEVLQLPHRPSWADRHQEFIYAALAAMPAHHDRLYRLGARLEHAHDRLELGPIVPTHGDLYEAHLLVDPVSGRVQHILDVDGAGPGYRVDDFACLVGHLAVLGPEDHAPWGWQAALRTFRQLSAHTNPATLAVRAAAVVISLMPTYQPDEATRHRALTYLSIAEALLELA